MFLLRFILEVVLGGSLSALAQNVNIDGGQPDNTNTTIVTSDSSGNVFNNDGSSSSGGQVSIPYSSSSTESSVSLVPTSSSPLTTSSDPTSSLFTSSSSYFIQASSSSYIQVTNSYSSPLVFSSLSSQTYYVVPSSSSSVLQSTFSFQNGTLSSSSSSSTSSSFSSSSPSSTSTSSPSSTSTSSAETSTISTNTKQTYTSIIEGKTVLSDYYTTITLIPTATSNSKNQSPGGVSKKNRNIILGCCLGIGIPVILIIALFIYVTCIRSKKIDFIDSDGKVVSTYKMNKFKVFWFFLMGKSISSIDDPDDDHSNNFNEKDLAGIPRTTNAFNFDNISSDVSNNSLIDSPLSNDQNYQSFFNEAPFEHNDEYYNFTHAQQSNSNDNFGYENESQVESGEYSNSDSDVPKILNIANPS